MASTLSGQDSATPDPASPRLHPLGSPGPITPFELEESLHAGYLVAGGLGRGTTKSTKPTGMGPPAEALGTSAQREQEAIETIIKAEEERWMKDAGSSHATRV